MKKFDQIERKNGLLQVPPNSKFDIDDPFYQARAKDLAFRTIGEIGEATEAFRHSPTLEPFDEEMSDVYHFLMELMIFVEITTEDIFSAWCKPELELQGLFECAEKELETPVDASAEPEEWLIRQSAYNLTELIVLAMNELKMKPWKSSFVGKETNKARFYQLIAEAHYEFIKMCVYSGIGPDDLYESYFEKAIINDKRINNGH